VRVPRSYLGERQPATVAAEVGNIDLAPTILALAHASPCAAPGSCRTLDGRSLVDLLRGETPGWVADRAILTEFANREPRSGVCSYRGLQLSSRAYVQFTRVAGSAGCVPAAERELYDLRSDPFELDNELPAPPGSVAAATAASLAAELRRLRDCAGIAGRDRAPSSGRFCD
jgi:arylsulfatase A-like enzyme